MATDQPTPPDLGNLTNVQFLALPDWSVLATNIPGKDDTFESMIDCVVALLYRVIRDNFAYENEAWACRAVTPISLKIAALEQNAAVHWRETDWPAVGLTLAQLVGVTPLPDILFSCHGTKLDDVSGTLELNPPTPGTSIVYALVSAQGSVGANPLPFLFGLRTHAERWVYADDTTLVRQQQIAYQASYSLPEWPQDTLEPIILAKVADFTSPVDVGPSNRIGFEFGLGPAPSADPNSNTRDYCLYLLWYDSGDAEQRSIALLPSEPVPFPDAEPIAITPGRRITLGFQRYFRGPPDEDWVVRFYINGRQATDVLGPFPGAPSIAQVSDLRLHIGSAQLGKSYTGGPINNVMVWANADPVAVPAAMLAAYQRGEGFQAVP